MKKMIILFMFLCIAFVGCSSEGIRLESDFNYDFDDSFIQDTTNLSDYFDEFYKVADDLMDSLSKEMDEQGTFTLVEGTIYQRDELPLENPNYYTQEVPIHSAYGYFSMMLMDVYSGVFTGTLGENEAYYLDYGFNETGGYITKKLYDTNHQTTTYLKNSFVILDDKIQFEQLNFSLDTEYMTYLVYNGVEMYRYTYHDLGNYSFNYLNTETYDYFSMFILGNLNSVTYYDHSEQIRYDQNDNYTSVTKYDDFTPVVTLINENDQFNLNIYLRSMSGWDSLSYENSYVSDGDDQIIYEQPFVKVYNDGLEVYRDYNIPLLIYRVANYQTMYFDIELDDITTYQMPEGFTGDITFDTLYEIIVGLDDINYIYELINLNKLDIRDYCKNIYDGFYQEITD